jgi:hypothetical protein
MAALSRNLAVELVARLSKVVPAQFQVRAEGQDIGVYIQGRSLGGSGATSIVEEEDDRDLSDKAEVAIRAVLDAVQDCIVEYLHEPWPRARDGALAMPGARSDGKHVYFWYGPDVEFSPIDLKRIASGSAE